MKTHEVTDVANKEKLSLSFRYIHDGHVKEVFMDFTEVERTTGQVLADIILKQLGLMFSIHVQPNVTMAA